jgi:hypothetical protein
MSYGRFLSWRQKQKDNECCTERKEEREKKRRDE